MRRKPIHLTRNNFEAEALGLRNLPVVVEFWADWCTPCRTMAPVLDELAAELDGRAVIAKLNVDEEPALAEAARIQAVPTLVLLVNGEVRDVIEGATSKRVLRAKVESLLKPKPAKSTAWRKAAAILS